MLRIVNAPNDPDPVEPMPRSVLLALQELIPCDGVTFNMFDADRRETYLCQSVGDVEALLPPADLPMLNRAFWTHYWDSPCCCYPDVSGDLASVTTMSDFKSDRDLHSSPMYSEYFRFLKVEREMMLCLPSQPGRVLRLLFWRGPGSDFCQRDRDLLTLLRPHLYQAYCTQRERQRGTPQLTERQRQLLGLVAAGHTNTQIARRLSISEATVRKHLEHIFDRLQVTSRTAAVTSVFGTQDHLLDRLTLTTNG
jgi:DNA-binding CsgD family transcriptional regulator